MPINQYPVWKYLLLVVISICGLLYAAPNLFGEDPAIQISEVRANELTVNTAAIVKTALNTAHLSYKSIEKQGSSSLLIRFNNTQIQLQAHDYLKATLGDDYTVALNLAPSTPRWLRTIGAQPMKLGLDLRGGVHFLLNVDVSSLIKSRTNEDMRSLADGLRKANIRYAGIDSEQGNKITINFRDAANMNAAYNYLIQHFSDFKVFKNTLDRQYFITAQITQDALNSVRNYAVDQAMTVLRKRVNELGIAEPVVQRQGATEIAVDLPGIQDAAHAQEILGGTATLEFHLVDETHDIQSALAGQLPFGSGIYQMADNLPILLYNRILLQGSSIIGSTASFGDDGKPNVNIRISGPEVNLFHKVTNDNIGHRMAIVYVETKLVNQVINGKVVTIPQKLEHVISAPVIQSALGNNFQITGLVSSQESQNLALLLRAGALLAPMSIIEERTVGPSLGQDNIHKGFISVLVGFLLIVAFIGFYYRVFGWIANLALAMNVVLVIAVLSLLGATLTLPGIAGIVLTVGMAIDANVLIFERIREELRQGMSLQASIHSGYERAFVTIVDANLTTLIVAILLFALGTGPVQGFAVTLTVGILTSMLTAITGTRAVVNLLYGGRPIKKISIGIKINSTHQTISNQQLR